MQLTMVLWRFRHMSGISERLSGKYEQYRFAALNTRKSSFFDTYLHIGCVEIARYTAIFDVVFPHIPESLCILVASMQRFVTATIFQTASETHTFGVCGHDCASTCPATRSPNVPKNRGEVHT